RHGLAERRLLEHRGELVLEAGRRHLREVDEVAVGVAELEGRGHLAIIAKIAETGRKDATASVLPAKGPECDAARSSARRTRKHSFPRQTLSGIPRRRGDLAAFQCHAAQS